MSTMSDLKCTSCGEPLERLRYFSRQLLTADDMSAEQAYFRERMRRHNRYLLGWGVACGCAVEPVPGAEGWQVRVCPGYVVGPQGDEIAIEQCVDVDLQVGAPEQPCSVRWPCPPLGEMPAPNDGRDTVYVAVRYAECYSRPMRVHPAGCGCDETTCEYSRIRDSFEIKVLWELPASHEKAALDDQQWCDAVQKTPADLLRRLRTFPVPPCPECEADPWVVLATITLPKQGTGDKAADNSANQPQISYRDRRALLATQRLQTAMLCLLASPTSPGKEVKRRG